MLHTKIQTQREGGRGVYILKRSKTPFFQVFNLLATGVVNVSTTQGAQNI